MPEKNHGAGLAYVYLLLTAMFWGANAVAGKLAVGHISPLLLTSLRWLTALVTIVLISVPQLKRDSAKIRRHLPYLLAMGMLGFTAFNAFLYTALHYTTAINVVIEQAGMPMLIFVGNFLIFRTRVSAGQVAGFMLTLLGVALTASHGDLALLLRLKLNFGDALMLLAVTVYAAYTICLRFKPDLHWKSMMAATATGALMAAIPLAFYEFSQGAMLAPDLKGWLVVLYTGIFPSLVAQIFFILGVQAIGGNRAGLFVNMVPIFGTLFSVIIIGEPLHTFHMIALTLVIGGIVIAERNRPIEKPA
jgi:drug/metabolite transporter (DMT)-like permease